MQQRTKELQVNQTEIRELMNDPVAQIIDFESRLPSYVEELIQAKRLAGR
jgi:hypothetical protein